ncbi:guanylate-binding protein 1-like isoform X1 [Lepisosteus oculatus]|uniref:guanylate-binding protein 1-like isoform X1 n=2 Tax=Lepisosteus oculatus TaxID=7918 RepID=UPI0037111ED9
METPVCLIENGQDGQFCVNPIALEILNQISQHVVVVSVVGLYRTGKSYLMNKLSGKKRGFALGSTIQSHTKGIWMWCVPHPTKPDHTLVLLDTEGLGDVEKGDQKNDCWIFALAILLSSTLVYNSRGTIDNNALENLQYVTELTDLIKVKSPRDPKPASGDDDDEDEEDSQYVRYFPNFVWAVRDFTLELKIEGRPVTEDEYLEHALSLKKGTNRKVSDYNLPRQCIRNFFPLRRCFVFGSPAAPDAMTRLETLDERDLSASFLEATQRFCQHVFNQSPVKTIKGGHPVSGRMLGILASTYVGTISSGDVPCLENAVLTMAQIENQAAVQEGMKVYKEGMDKAVTFPASLEGLSQQHRHWEKLALERFASKSFKDDSGQHMSDLGEKIAEYYDCILMRNEEASINTCHVLLAELSTPIAKKLEEGFYAKPGGYKLYCKDRDALVAQFRAEPNKGVKAEEVLEQSLKEKEVEANTILRADEELTEKEKQIAEQHERAALAEQQRKAQEEQRLEMEQVLQDERGRHQEQMQLAQKKLEQELENCRVEAERALESKLKEQEQLQRKGFEDQAAAMTREIGRLKEEASKGSSWKDFIKPVLSTAADIVSTIYEYKTLRRLMRR